jgi:aspartate-semialdehyde dehydrogenase
LAETIALVGGESLLGREVRDAVGQSRLGAALRLIAAPGEEEGKLTNAAGEPAVIAKMDRESFEGAGAIVLACSPETARQVEAFRPAGTLVDLSYALEDLPGARLRAPQVEAHDFRVAHDAIQVIAHPAAIALALLLNRIHPVFRVERTVANVFEPASERGIAGIDELQVQTVNLLQFKPLPKAVYDAQVSYAMLPRFGEDAPTKLEDVESRIERHLATLLANAGDAPVPSLRLSQAPVFHGYSFSLWIEFAERPAVVALEHLLDEAPIEVRNASAEPPTNIGAAGQSGVTVGAILPDRNNPRAMWIWMAADNLKLSADNALLVLQEVL